MNRSIWRKLIILVSIFVSLFYLGYRIFFTLNLTSPYAVFASFFLLLGESFGVISLLLYFLQVWEIEEPPIPPVPEGKTVDVLVPTYNEDVALLRATLQACISIDYPHRTFLCDDGGTDQKVYDPDPDKAAAAKARAKQLKALCAELGVTYITRPDNMHNKAGNLNHALDHTDGEFVIVLDADHVPEPHFITRILGYFNDPKLGYVQTPHAFYNFDSFQARHDHKKGYYWDEGQLFYHVIQLGRNHFNCPIFAGSAVMFRRKALEDVGGIATETITEDLHTGMRINAQGWKSKAISERLISGQAAPDVTTFHSQRLRWAMGNMSIMAFDMPLFMKGLTLAQRLSYFGSMFHWTSGVFKVAIYATPILMLFTGVPPVREFSWTLGIIMAIYLSVSVFGTKIIGNGFASFWNGELFNMATFWTMFKASLRTMLRQGTRRFVVTSKRGRQSNSTLPYIMPHIILILVSVTAIVWGWLPIIQGISFDHIKPILATVWSIFHMSLAGTVIYRSLWPDDKRYSYRHVVQLPVSYQSVMVDGNLSAPRAGLTMDLSETGTSLVTYEPIAPESQVQLIIRWQDQEFHCTAKIVWSSPMDNNGQFEAGIVGGYRHGLEFLDLQPQQVDTLNRFTLSYGVPMLYRSYALAREKTLGRKVKHTLLPKRQLPREDFHLPVLLRPMGENGVAREYACVTQDVNKRAFSAYTHQRFETNSQFHFALATPMGEIAGTAKVLRCQTIQLAGRTLQRVVLEPSQFESQGRSKFQALSSKSDWKPVANALKPQRGERKVPYGGHLFSITLMSLLLVVGSFFLQRLYYSDDFFLRQLAQSDRPVTAADLDRLETIYFENTTRDFYVDEDRMILLFDALSRVDQTSEQQSIAAWLATNVSMSAEIPPSDLQLLEESKRMIKDGRETEDVRRNFLLHSARADVIEGSLDSALSYYDLYVQRYPNELTVRDEMAGLLLSLKRSGDVINLFADVPTEALDGKARWTLLLANGLENKIGPAERHAQAYLAANPGDLQAQRISEKLTEYRTEVQQAQSFFERLMANNIGDARLQARFGLLAVGYRDYPKALDILQPLVARADTLPEVVRGYVDSTAGLDEQDLSKVQPEVLVSIARSLEANSEFTIDQSFLNRLGWSLQRMGLIERSAEVYRRALTMQPNDPELYRKLLGLYLESRQFNEALALLDREGDDPETEYLWVSIQLAQQNFDEAERSCEKILAQNPFDTRARRLMANVLTSQKNFDGALVILEQLDKEKPGQEELRTDLANLKLYTKRYAEALKGYEELFEMTPDDREVWQGFIDAAAGVITSDGVLSDAQKNHLVRIAKELLLNPGDNPTMLARMGWVLSQTGERDRALALVDQAAALKPTDATVRREIAAVYASMEQFDKALATVEGLPQEIEDRFRAVAFHERAGEYAKAVEICKAIVATHEPNRATDLQAAEAVDRARDMIFGLHIAAEEYELAQEFFASELLNNPGDENIQMRAAQIAQYSGNYSDALARFEGLVKANPKDTTRWSGFIDAVAASIDANQSTEMPLNSSQKSMTEELADKMLARTDVKAQDLPSMASLAWVMAKLKENERADQLVKVVVEHNPSQPEVRHQIAGVLGTLGKFDEAIAMYQKQTNLTPKEQLELTRLLTAKQDFEGAEQTLRQLLEQIPSSVGPQRPEDVNLQREAQNLLVDVLVWNQKYVLASAELEKLITQYPSEESFHARHAQLELWQQKSQSAVEEYTLLLEQDINHPEWWVDFINAASASSSVEVATSAPILPLKTARVAVQLSQHKELVPLLTQTRQQEEQRLRKEGSWPEDALPVQEHVAIALTRLSQVLHRAGGVYPSINKQVAPTEIALQAAALQPKDVGIRRELAGTLSSLQETRVARSLLEGIPHTQEDKLLLSNLFAAEQNFPAAEAVLRELLQEQPNSSEARLQLAQVLSWYSQADERWMQKTSEAVSLYAALIKLRPDDLLLRKAYGDALLKLGQYPQALEQIQLVLSQNRNQPEHWLKFIDAAAGTVQQKVPLNQSHQSIANVIYAAEETQPSLQADYLARFASVMRALRQYDRAVQLLQRSIKKDKTNAESKLRLAQMLSEMGRFAEADYYYQTILSNQVSLNR